MTAADPESPSDVWCYSVAAAADPGVVLRVLEQFAKRGLVPLRLLAIAAGARAEVLDIDVQVAGLGADTADHIAESLRQLVHVERVLTAVKTPAERAAHHHELSR